MCAGSRGQPLIPWPNRLDGGRYRFAGVAHQVPINDVAGGTAIHGLTNWAGWERSQGTTREVTLTHTLYPKPGWDWILDLAINYGLTPDGLRVTTTATNCSADPCPFGAGFHPYFRPPSGRVEDVVLELPADGYDVTDDRLIPTGHAPVDDTPWDFRKPRRIGDLAINLGFNTLRRDPDGVARFTARQPDTDWSVAVLFGPGWDWAVVYTAEMLVKGRRESVAIEPMTGPANMLQSGDNLLTLQPGQTWEAWWSIHPGWGSLS